MTFPTAGAQVYYNGDGEPLGWDYPGYDDGPDPDDFDDPEDFDDDGQEDWVLCDECGAEFEGESGELEQHRKDVHGFSG